MMKKDKLIGSLAVFKSNLIEEDFMSTYIPFVAKVLASELAANSSVVKVESIIKDFESEYGFTIDRAPMVTILNKCVKQDLIRKCKNGTYSINKEKCEAVAISEEKVSENSKKYREVLNKLQQYYLDSYDIKLDIDEIEIYLLSFLNDNSAKTLVVNFDAEESDLYTAKQHKYIISTFIAYCYENDKETFRMISDLATAYLMSSAIAYGDQDERTMVDGFKNLVIYFDTPLLLRVLGLNEEAMQSSVLVMMEQLLSLGCQFRVFSHTYDELRCILKDCLRWIENPAYDEFHASYALRTFVDKHYSKTEIQEYIDVLELKLKHYKIQIDDEDYYAGKYYHSTVDEKYIESSIINIYKNQNPLFNEKQKESTIIYDTKSLGHILKLQSGNTKRIRTYRQAKYVLLTTNTTLAYVTRQFPDSVNPGAGYNVYPCITEVFLGTTIWLAAPIKKIEDFSQKKLMADCMSLIEPSEALLHTLQEYIERALKDESISEEQYYLLKTKAFTGNYVMQRTLGDETRFTDKIAEEVLEEIENEIKAPYVTQINTLKNTNNELRDENSKYKTLVQKSEKEKQKEMETKIKEQDEIKGIVDKTISNFLFVGLGSIILPFIGWAISLIGVLAIPKEFLVWLIILAVVLNSAYLLIKLNCFRLYEKLETYLIYKEEVSRYKKQIRAEKR